VEATDIFLDRLPSFSRDAGCGGIYCWLTEGFDLADLQDANELV
jgi:hypothetical protein